MSSPGDIIYNIYSRLDKLAEQEAKEQGYDANVKNRILNHYEEEFAKWLVDKFKNEKLN
jgi:hypothetical protein